MRITSYYLKPASNPVSFGAGFKSSKYEKYYSKNDIKDTKVEKKPLLKISPKDLEEVNLSKEDYLLFEKMAYSVGRKAITYAKQYQDKQKSLDEILKMYNEEAIKSQIQKTYGFPFDFSDEKDISKKFQNQSGAEESYFDMLYDLVLDAKLSPSVFYGLTEKNSISRRTKEDLDKLYEAYINQEDIVEKFVPKFKNKEEALLSIPVGEVCQIGKNEHISIKTKDDSIEDLFLTPETYFELFPPIERFAGCQNEQGDCYLLAAVDSLYQNPSTRHLILKLFKENPDNTVDMVWQGWKKEGDEVVSNSLNPVVEDIQKQLEKNDWTNSNRLSKTCEAFRAIELLNAQSSIMNSRKKAKERTEDIKNLNKFYFGDNVTLSKKERKMFTKLAQQENNSLVWVKEKDCALYVNKKRARELYKELQEKNDFMSEYTKVVIERLLSKFNDDKLEDYILEDSEILPLEVIEKLTGESFSSPLNFYNDGGFSVKTFKKVARCDLKRGTAHGLKNELFQKDINQKAAFTISSYRKRPEYGIYTSHHCYSLEPIDNENGRMFIVRNPHNLNNEMIFDYDALEEAFGCLIIASDFE